MNKKLLYLSIVFALTGCQNTKSFHIPLFENIISYKEDKVSNSKNYDEKKEKDFMYNVMAGQLELNEGNTQRAIERYEASLSEKKNEIAYTLLSLYYKENDYTNVKRIASIIESYKIKSNNIGDNLLASLLNEHYEISSSYLNEIFKQVNLEENIISVSLLEEYVKLYKGMADLVFFSNNNIDMFKQYIDNDQFTLFKFFYLYDYSNSQGQEPDEAIKYLINNMNKTNVLHNFTLFRMAYIENYQVDVYKDEMIYLTGILNNYVFDTNTLEKLYSNDITAYEKVKLNLSLKYKDNVDFWYFLSVLENKHDPEKSLSYLNAAYNLIISKETSHQLKDKIITQIISKMIDKNIYNVSIYLKNINDYEQRKEIFKLIITKAIKTNNYNDSILENYNHLIRPVDKYLIVSKTYNYFEEYELAMTYLERADELELSNNEVTLERNIILSKVNPKIAINESELYLEKNNTPEAKIVLLYAKLNNKEDIKKGREDIRSIYYKYDQKKLNIKEYYQFSTYVYSRYNYEIGKYDRAKEVIEQLAIGNNYIYLADYGRILWKLNQRTKAKRLFNKSKEIFDSKYLSNILKELNIKSLE